MDYKKLNRIAGWSVFGIATIVYLMTIEPTASFWDCGEFIASAYKLEVGHPPGAPLFMLLGRLFSMFVPAAYAATAVNVLSALASSFTILFLYFSITAIGRKMATAKGGEITEGKTWAIVASGIIGGLAYTFSDSFWFSAVEGEVYALSSLFTAMVFWAILKWDEIVDTEGGRASRWLVLIAYLMGLSIGVHLLNLLCIPAIAFIYYFKKYKPSVKGVIYTFAISAAVLGFIQKIIIPGTFAMAGNFELFFVNTLGMPFNSGVVFYVLFIIAIIVLLLRYSQKKANPVLNTAVWSIGVILIGYTSFTTIMVRSAANPPMDENNPEHVFSLVQYLNREQYGDRPLFSGQYWNTPVDSKDSRKDGSPVYSQVYSVEKSGRSIASFIHEWEADQYIADNAPNAEKVQKYIVSDERKGASYNYDKEFTTIFPRMYSPKASHVKEYKYWSNFKGKPISHNGPNGREIINKPTFGENLTFFFQYQVNWMYTRYFLWNFAGKQNDIQGHRGILDGNWLSGIKMIDEQKLGNRDQLPESMTTNKGFNTLFFLPLILGLIGFFFQMNKDIKTWSVVTLLFFFTGFAILLYLNQYPLQPRERDYAYVGSFYAFAIWIGLGVYAIWDLARSITKEQTKKVAIYTFGSALAFYLVELLGGGDHTISYSIGYMGIVAFGIIFGLKMLAGKMEGKPLAITALVLTLFVPIVMAHQGWDDHSRADRRTGVDFAKNYLDSCAPNAILFTNGDNDTFPLWYAQEVEGYRTDVRVVNLSLLNTDWYANQMQRKAYDSDPVPFNMSESKYRQGTRDIVLLDPNNQNGNKTPIDIKRLIDFSLNDRNMVRVGGGEQLAYMPSKHFKLSVDKEKVVANGTVAVEDTAKIVDEVVWSLNKSYILKNTYLALSLIANFDWDRPIYFAVTTGPDAYMGLMDYFELEGLAYRFVPIKHGKNSGNPNLYGKVNADVMYDNVMNKFSWGGMDDKDIYMDENNRRMTTNFRLQFNNLAEQLIKEGDTKRAKDVLDLTLKVMPERNVAFDRLLVPIIDTYSRIGEKEQVLELSNRLFELYEQDLTYYASLEDNLLPSVSNELRMAYYVLSSTKDLAIKADPNAEVAKDLDKRFASMDSLIRETMNRSNRVQKKSF